MEEGQAFLGQGGLGLAGAKGAKGAIAAMANNGRSLFSQAALLGGFLPTAFKDCPAGAAASTSGGFPSHGQVTNCDPT